MSFFVIEEHLLHMPISRPTRFPKPSSSNPKKGSVIYDPQSVAKKDKNGERMGGESLYKEKGVKPLSPNPLILLVSPVGIEPTTY